MPLSDIIETNSVYVSSSRVKVEENGQKCILINTQRGAVKKVKVDGGVFKNEECCDFLCANSQKCFFIELKGADVRKGCSQLKSTLQRLSQYFPNTEKICVLVHTRHPRMDSKLQIAEKSIRSLGAHFLKGRSPVECDI